MKTRATILCLIVFFSAIHVGVAYAVISINEVMYDLDGADTGREWIEVYNDGGATVDMSTYRLFEGDTNHKITLYQGDKNIPNNGYAIITSDKLKFKKDWPNFTGIIFDSTFSLANTGEEISIKDIVKDITDTKENIIDKYSYNSSTGGAGDGNSLQKINGVWVASRPTPGLPNKIYLKPKANVPVDKNLSPKPKDSTEKIIGKASGVLPENNQNEVNQISDQNLVDNKTPAYFYPAVFGMLIAFGSFSVYAVRKKVNTEKEDDDFEILDY